MLHKDPSLVDPKTVSLIQELQSTSFLSDFYLVGGTSLTFQLGHRNSIDIDLFTRNLFDSEELILQLSQHFDVISTFQKKSTLLAIVNGVKADFVRHDYELLRPPITEEGITFLSKEDIAAMKLNAISNSGKRLKDFIDVYYLLEHFSMEEMIGFYAIKYPRFNPLIALRSVNYFADIDLAIDPPKLKEKLPLEEIKARINDAVLHSKKRFG
jgi:hypothetical protein